jgi:hypothetical protein
MVVASAHAVHPNQPDMRCSEQARYNPVWPSRDDIDWYRPAKMTRASFRLRASGGYSVSQAANRPKALRKTMLAKISTIHMARRPRFEFPRRNGDKSRRPK